MQSRRVRSRVDSLIDVRHVNSGSPLSFAVCSNKIIKVGEIQQDFVGVFDKKLFHSRFLDMR